MFDISQMEEHFDIEEARGLNDQITLIKLSVTFSINNYKTQHGGILKLETPISKNSTDEEMFEAYKQQLGNDRWELVRNESFKYLSQEREIDELTVFVKNEIKSVRKLYAKLILVEKNMWDAVENYFSSSERTMQERIFFEDSNDWENTNEILQSVALNVLNLSQPELDQLFDEAIALEKSLSW